MFKCRSEGCGLERRNFIGGSDARIIMGDDEAALLRLWREKRGEAEPEDLSGNLIVQLGVVTEPLNRAWYERNTGQGITTERFVMRRCPAGLRSCASRSVGTRSQPCRPLRSTMRPG